MRPRHVPLREYLEVISSSEAERLRQIVTEIINRTGGNPEQLQAELEKFNQEVARWRKSLFHWVQEQVDLLGLGLDLAFLPAGVSIPGLNSIVGLVVKALLGGDFLKNSRLLGNLEDRVFGFIGGVSPAAVRISRIRRKITPNFPNRFFPTQYRAFRGTLPELLHPESASLPEPGVLPGAS
ncbi:MAG: hypothetical protein HPY90_12385, partial [Syntrophothermus sp.]|uniref:hypothetical protein n=1 Tax=Syntrophothermus sp. TaxID=2736299 RepID=UPI00257EE989